MIEVLDVGFVELVDMMGDEESVVRAARVSFAGDTEKFSVERNRNLMKYMLENHHSSPFEHIVFSFHLKCPLFVRSQIHRHRTFSYSEISRRYTSDDLEFYIPDSLRKQSDNNRQASKDEYVSTMLDMEMKQHFGSEWISSRHFMKYYTMQALYAYNTMIENGVAREQARMVLPQNLYTRFYMTGNLHNWFHFLDLRDSEHAQYETRLYAQAIKSLIKEKIPTIMEIWENSK